MNSPSRETNEAQGAGVYSDTPSVDTSPAGTPGTSSVRVYDRPEETSKTPGMLGIILTLLVVLAISWFVWQALF